MIGANEQRTHPTAFQPSGAPQFDICSPSPCCVMARIYDNSLVVLPKWHFSGCRVAAVAQARPTRASSQPCHEIRARGAGECDMDVCLSCFFAPSPPSTRLCGQLHPREIRAAPEVGSRLFAIAPAACIAMRATGVLVLSSSGEPAPTL